MPSDYCNSAAAMSGARPPASGEARARRETAKDAKVLTAERAEDAEVGVTALAVSGDGVIARWVEIIKRLKPSLQREGRLWDERVMGR